MLGYNELLKNSCSYEKYKGVDKYNQKNYHEVVDKKCFISFDFSNQLGLNEQNIKLTKRVFIDNEFEPNVFDKIDGMEIISIKAVKGLKVDVIGWEIIC